MLKELGARWLVEMSQYFAENPQIIVNGFVKAGITGALDGDDQETESSTDNETESDFDVIAED